MQLSPLPVFSVLIAWVLVASAAQAARSDPASSPVRAQLAALQARNQKARATWRADGRYPKTVTQLAEPTEGRSPRDWADAFLARWPEIIGVPRADLRSREIRSGAGRTVVHFDQTHQGNLVVGHGLVIAFDDQNRVVSVTNDTTPLDRVRPGRLDELAARRMAVRAIHPEASEKAVVELASRVKIEKVVLAQGTDGTEGWHVHVVRQPLVGHYRVVIDAHRGEIIGMENRTVH